ncbi:alpha-amylase family glycosyl hydrolase [[Clostridium] polysaccharolyticum]|uniref:Glycosidase n=1 Tax=[Clostridium] polysaccharolyticum TaxID=29364 RepID=A0A1I0EIK1_9FIRM|nr:alpha-amylase family glycosyl hydrolase [[Clostridium] polysaccharolyticum]SET44279.1 Glycosidase [[Clostridium] polysaccharolyticum]
MSKKWKAFCSCVLTIVLLICSVYLPDNWVNLSADNGAENVVKSLNNVVEAVIDGREEKTALQLYRNGVYEKGIELGAGTHTYQVYVNGEAFGTEKEIQVEEAKTVFIRLQDEEVYDSVNNASEKFHTAKWVGNFAGLSFVKENNERYNIGNWSPADENAELAYVGGGIYTRTFYFEKLGTDLELPDGGYKVAFDNAWDYSIGYYGSNVALAIPAGTDHITIFADEISQQVYDSVRSGYYNVTQNSGNITYQAFHMKVSLIGTVRGEESINWSADAKGYEFYQISDHLYLYQDSLASGTYEYKTIMNYKNWYEKSGSNKVLQLEEPAQVVFLYDASTEELYDSVNDNSNVAAALGFETGKQEAERILTVPGTFPGPSWNTASNKMVYLENGIYSYTFKDVPAGNYQFKIATGTWVENYGQDGIKDGANYTVMVPAKQDVTIYYNDNSHRAVTSVSYEFNTLVLTGDGIKATLEDPELTGIYKAAVPMKAGTYNNLVLNYNGKENLTIGKVELAQDKEVTFYFDSATHLYYNDASMMETDKEAVLYNSKDSRYKSVFGAVAENEKVRFAIKTGSDVTKAILITQGNKLKTYEMTNDGGEDSQTWSATASFDTYGRYTYFFALYYGSYVQIYCDDDGYYGTGVLTNLSQLKPYDLVVYKAGYKTPDWMKNAVVYQIFPDRFFNGDKENDQAQITSRGDTNYEFVNDWYMYPENPEQEEQNPQAYPENACKGDLHWNNEIYGGDLKGITDRIDYLKALGVTVIYLNPIFSSISSHRYDAADYRKIDPVLGDLGDFSKLVKAAEDNGMHIILDGVFNHVSDDSIYFDRYYKFVGQNGKVGAYPYWAYVYDYMKEHTGASQSEAQASAKKHFDVLGVTDYSYTKWFRVDNMAMVDENQREVTDTIGERKGLPVYAYEGWWGYDSMPVIFSTNGSEYQTGNWAEQIIEGSKSVTQYWISQGSNGWRLDVANEVSDETWQHFRQSVKGLDSDAVIIGEIWDDATEYIIGDMYDSVMNYVFRNAVLDFAKGGKASASVKTLEKLRERYPKEAFYAMMNLVDSHDTARLLSYLDGVEDDRNQKDPAHAFPAYEKTSMTAKQRQYLVAFLQMTYPGAPTIYYGDELGLTGADDPDNRRAMPWGEGNKELVEWYAVLANLRSKYTALRTGSIEPLETANESIMGYVRADENASLTILANNSGKTVEYVLDTEKNVLYDMISGKEYVSENGKIKVIIPAYGGVVLTDVVKELDVNYDGLKAGYEKAYKVGAEVAEPEVSPSPAVKPSAKPTPEASVKPSVKPTPKASVRPSAKPTPKPVVKVPVVKLKTDKKKKRVTLFWKKDKDVKKYEITYSTNKNFKKSVKKIVTRNSTQKTLTGFQAKKTYYIRVRSCKMIKKKACYSKYSAVKKVKF